MNPTKAEIYKQFDHWLSSWNKHDLEGVMDFMHPDILFENWDGKIIKGKDTLKKAWTPWFINHNNFKFIREDVFFDEQEQKMVFQWQLEWPSIENKFIGQPEIRKGVDVMQFKDGLIVRKITYSKTAIQIDSLIINLQAV